MPCLHILYAEYGYLVYSIHMEQPPPRRKPGPRPKGYKRINVFLPRDLADWAMDQPEGLSGLLRRLLIEEYQRRTKAPKRSQDHDD
jgi:hypothetical protein